MDEYNRFTLSFALYVRMKYHSRGGSDGKKYLLMLKNRRKTHLIERERGERGAVYKRKKNNFILKWCMCSTAAAPHIHALLNLPLYALRRDISPSMYLILLFSPGLTPPDYFFSRFTPPPFNNFHVFLCGALQVSPQNFFLKQKEELSDSAREPSHLGGGAAEETLK